MYNTILSSYQIRSIMRHRSELKEQIERATKAHEFAFITRIMSHLDWLEETFSDDIAFMLKREAEEAEQDRRDAERAAGDDDFNQDTDFNFIQEGA